MRALYGILVLMVLFLFENMSGDNRIVMYIKHAPENLRTQAIQELKLPANQPDVTKAAAPALGGFAALYGGYFDISTQNGLVSFPLRHASPKIFVAVTPQIELINIKGFTFSHRAFMQSPIKSELYSFQLTKKEEKDTDGKTVSTTSYWEVKKESLPTTQIINPLTLVLLTNPNNVIIPEGNFLATDSPQLILPDVFVVNRAETDQALLRALDIKRYFEQITIEEKKGSDTSTQELITNI